MSLTLISLIQISRTQGFKTVQLVEQFVVSEGILFQPNIYYTIWITQIFPTTKSSVMQGLGANSLLNTNFTITIFNQKKVFQICAWWCLWCFWGKKSCTKHYWWLSDFSLSWLLLIRVRYMYYSYFTVVELPASNWRVSSFYPD